MSPRRPVHAALEAEALRRRLVAFIPEPEPALEPESAPEVLVDPSAFQTGQQRARAALVAFLDTLPESLATRTRDEGRGAAYEAQQIRATLRRSGLEV